MENLSRINSFINDVNKYDLHSIDILSREDREFIKLCKDIIASNKVDYISKYNKDEFKNKIKSIKSKLSPQNSSTISRIEQFNPKISNNKSLDSKLSLVSLSRKIQGFANFILNSIIRSISKQGKRVFSQGNTRKSTAKTNQLASKIIDKHHYLKGKEQVDPSQYAWHLNLALLRDAYDEASDPQEKKEIEFLINNYLDKATPLRARETKKLVKDFESNYQVHPQSDYLYYRTGFLEKMELASSFNRDLALGNESPLILTDTDELAYLFPLSFKVMDEKDDTQWADSIQKVLTEHFTKYPTINEGLKVPLPLGILFDLTSQLKDSIKTNGSKEKDAEFRRQLDQFKAKITSAIDKSIKNLAIQYPELKTDAVRRKAEQFVQDNITPISRVKVNENLGGIKVLPIFSKLDKKILEEKYSHFIEFISHTGMAIGAVSMRRHVMNAYKLRPDISYAVEGQNAIYFDSKSSLTERALFKRLSEKFSSDKLKDQPQVAIMGKSTMQLLNGLINNISQEKWDSLHKNPTTRKILQTSFYQIITHLATAELQMRDFPKFVQSIELVHAEMATVLELTRPYHEEDFEQIYKKQLDTVIPEGLKSHLKVGIGKTATNLFAGINAALMQEKSEITRCYSKGFYFEQVAIMGDNYKLDSLLKDDKVTQVDLYCCQTNPNIEIATNHTNYEYIEIAADIRKILTQKPATKHMTVAVDCTIEHLKSAKIQKLLSEFEKEIKDGTLNFVFFHSGQKFDMLGMDNYYGSPFYMVNNGTKHWEPFNSLLNNPVHKTDSLSQQWFCLSNEFAADSIDQYRQVIFENTKEIMKQIPKKLLPTGKASQKLRVSTFDKEIEPCFIDLKIVGFGHQLKTRLMIAHFYKKCDEHGIKAFRRPGFGFYHANITFVAGENDSTSIRINPGLDPKENAVILEYLNEISKHSWERAIILEYINEISKHVWKRIIL